MQWGTLISICKYVFDMWENRNIFRPRSNIYDGDFFEKKSRLLAIILLLKSSIIDPKDTLQRKSSKKKILNKILQKDSYKSCSETELFKNLLIILIYF